MTEYPPPGFVDPGIGGFVGDLGPICRHDTGGHIHSGFVVEQRHCNPSDICHGGWLSTFADVSLVRVGAVGIESGLVTVSLTVDFVGAAALGEWVESRCEVVGRTGSMVFVQGTATSNGRPTLRMSGIFKILRPRS